MSFFNWSDFDFFTKVSLVVCAALVVALIAAIIVVYLVTRNSDKKLFATKELTYGAVCLATAFALSFFGYEMPQGGTVTPASTVPIMIFCYYFGFRKGLVVTTAYMLLQILQSPYALHPLGIVLDYVLPYLALIFFGILSKKRNLFKSADLDSEMSATLKKNINFFVAAGLYIFVRYFSHVLSGVILYASYAAEAGFDNVWVYSFVYNSFFLVDAALALVGACALLFHKAFDKFMTLNSQSLAANPA